MSFEYEKPKSWVVVLNAGDGAGFSRHEHDTQQDASVHLDKVKSNPFTCHWQANAYNIHTGETL